MRRAFSFLLFFVTLYASGLPHGLAASQSVDSAELVWYALKDAGYDVGNTPFNIKEHFFNNHEIQPYAKKNFDVIGAKEASKQRGSLQPGDILLFKSKIGGDQHVAIFSGYDDKGNIQFFGSQKSTGPAMVSKHTAPGEYWNGKSQEIIGALRAKPEFQVNDPKHGRIPDPPPAKPAGPNSGLLTAPTHAGHSLYKQALGACRA